MDVRVAAVIADVVLPLPAGVRFDEYGALRGADRSMEAQGRVVKTGICHSIRRAIGLEGADIWIAGSQPQRHHRRFYDLKDFHAPIGQRQRNLNGLRRRRRIFHGRLPQRAGQALEIQCQGAVFAGADVHFAAWRQGDAVFFYIGPEALLCLHIAEQ